MIDMIRGKRLIKEKPRYCSNSAFFKVNLAKTYSVAGMANPELQR
jgi:hypothetical protein